MNIIFLKGDTQNSQSPESDALRRKLKGKLSKIEWFHKANIKKLTSANLWENILNVKD